MFDDGGDKILVRVISGVEHSKNGVVVGLRATASEDNFLRARADQIGDLFTRGFDGRASFLPDGVNGCRVAEFLEK